MHALILAGGSGTRFWPLSRRDRPKQLLALDGGRSLLQATVDRLAPLVPPERVWISTTERLAGAIRAQLPEVPAAQVLVEPVGRNTAPAIGWAVRSMPEAVRGDAIAVLPADHRVADPAAFRRTLDAAAGAALAGDRIMTLGVEPRWAETGYGYLELGEILGDEAPGATVRRVARFTEKPDAATAARWVEAGSHLWNAGIFVFRGGRLLAALAEHAPEIADGLEAMAADPASVAARYPSLPKISIDYAVMEREAELGTLALDCGWDDLGSWQALAKVLPAGGDGNVVRGDVLALDARDNLLWADAGTVAVVGVEGLAVVRTGDAVLVMPKERAQDVRAVVDALGENDRDELL